MTSPWLYPSLASLALLMSALPALFALPLPAAGRGSVEVRAGTCDLAPFDPQPTAHHVGNAVAIHGCVQLEDVEHPSVGGLAVGFVGAVCDFLAGWARLVLLPLLHLPHCFAELFVRSMNGPLQTGPSAPGAAEVPPGLCCSWAVSGDRWFRPSLRTPRGTNPKHRSFLSTQARP